MPGSRARSRVRARASRTARSRASARSRLVQAQRGEEGLLRDLDRADPLHAPLSLFLLLEQLALAADVAAIALGRDVLAQRLHVGARDHARADRRLDRHLVLLARDELLE